MPVIYKSVFVKYVWKDTDKKRRYKVLEKIINLPFAPVPGMEVSEGDWFSGIIERVVWDNADNFFSIKVIDITPKKGVSAELLFDVAIKQGWCDRSEKAYKILVAKLILKNL